ncbi:hypothetical protein ABPG77_003623 [Micractinium sp. CCAP 211/92]
MKQNRFQRIAAVALARAQPAGWALFVLGVAAFLLLPLAGKKCYLDEKALLVGGAAPTIRQSGAFGACMAGYEQALHPAAAGDLAATVAAAAAAVATAMRAGPALTFHQHNYTSNAGSSSGTAAALCSTWHTVARSPRGDGSEGFVLLLPLHARRPAAAALAAALGTAAAAHLRQSGWLAKDAVLVFVDASCGGGALEGAQAWLSAYNSAQGLFTFPRAGLLQQALVLELAGAAPAAAPAGAATWAELSVHGAAGQLPNLDMYYLIKRNLDLHTAIPAVLRASEAPLPAWAQWAAVAAGAAASAARLGSAQAAQRHAAELATLTAFAGQLASGRPTGAHAPFLGMQVDAATLTLHLSALPEAPPASSDGGSAQPPSPQLQAAAASVLAAVEMVLRTLNNLQERLHHSTALYALLSPDRFVSIAAYLAPPGCLLLAALVQTVAASQAASGAPLPAWRSAWRRVAAAHAAAYAFGAACSQLLVHHAAAEDAWLPQCHDSSGDGLGLLQHLLWAAAAGLAAAEGAPALLAALAPVGGSSGGEVASASTGDVSGGTHASSDQLGAPIGAGKREEGPPSRASAADAATPAAVQRCTTAIALVAAVLQGSHLLLGQWVRCSAFLLAVLPLLALASQRRRGGAAGLALWAALLPGGAALVRQLCSGGAAWLAYLLLPYLLLGLV